MKYFNQRFPWIIFIALPLLLVIAIFLCSLKHDEITQGNPSLPDIASLSHPEGYYDNFKVEKISIVKRKDNRLFFSFSADKVLHRKRISKFFVYQNLKEIFLSGVQIDFYRYNMSPLKNKNSLIPLDDIGSSFTTLGKPSTPMEDYLAGNADIDLDLLSRILLENLSLNVFLSPDKKFSITAKEARINTDLENLVLEGPVMVMDSCGKEVLTSKAVWSEKFNRLYLPDGYTLKSEEHKGSAFFAINSQGELSRVWKCPNIEYVDFIEEREKVLYSYLSKNMPPYLRLIFGLPGND
jgi:hypothetical protein